MTEQGDTIMSYRFAAVATAALMLGTSGALAADLPTYEIMGFPVTQHQLSAVNSAYVQESSPVSTLTLAGMPASPVQILILTPRSEQVIAKAVDIPMAATRFSETAAIEAAR
jgi:hypothetical protein